jgi:hypothetical protein
MELDDALNQIADIRLQMARTRVFRGYRSSTTFFSAIVAAVAATIQTIYFPNPSQNLAAYLWLWLGAAALCIATVAVRIIMLLRKENSSLQRELTLQAVEQFTPCIVVGALLTFVLARVAWSSLWIMPGLWTILFGMGALASRRILPRGIALVGAFYLICGFLSIAWAQLASPFSPWSMGLPFGIGQSAAAAILYWNLERHHAPQ